MFEAKIEKPQQISDYVEEYQSLEDMLEMYEVDGDEDMCNFINRKLDIMYTKVYVIKRLGEIADVVAKEKLQ